MPKKNNKRNINYCSRGKRIERERRERPIGRGPTYIYIESGPVVRYFHGRADNSDQ